MTRELKLKERMIAYENGSPARIQHFMKVYAFADMIGEAEKLSEERQRWCTISGSVSQKKNTAAAAENFRRRRDRRSRRRCLPRWVIRETLSVGSAIWSVITIPTRILTDSITGFWWKQIFW